MQQKLQKKTLPKQEDRLFAHPIEHMIPGGVVTGKYVPDFGSCWPSLSGWSEQRGHALPSPRLTSTGVLL